MTNSGATAIALARRQSAHGPLLRKGMCLKSVRTLYGDVPGGVLDAATAWRNARHKRENFKLEDIPAGVPVFWLGGSAGHGHIAISTGGGRCLSTDIMRTGFFDSVPISLIATKWGNGLRFVGWTEDLNGVRVWTKPPTPAPEKPKPVPPAAPKPVDPKAQYALYVAALEKADHDHGRHIQSKYGARITVRTKVRAAIAAGPKVRKP